MSIATSTEIYLPGGPARVGEASALRMIEVWDGAIYHPARVIEQRSVALTRIVLRSRLFLDASSDHRLLGLQKERMVWLDVRQIARGEQLAVAPMPSEREAGGLAAITFEPVIEVSPLPGRHTVYALEVLSPEHRYVANKLVCRDRI